MLTEKSEVKNFYINRSDIIAESATGILIVVKDIKFWVPKNFAFNSNFMLTTRIGIIYSDNADYTAGKASDNPDAPMNKISGKKLAKYLMKEL